MPCWVVLDLSVWACVRCGLFRYGVLATWSGGAVMATQRLGRRERERARLADAVGARFPDMPDTARNSGKKRRDTVARTIRVHSGAVDLSLSFEGSREDLPAPMPSALKRARF